MSMLALSLCRSLAQAKDGEALLSEALAELNALELAALLHDWEYVWARPEQLQPDGPWRSWGSLTGRGWGKTRDKSEFVVGEVMAGRAGRVALISQTEDRTWEVQVEGESGLISCSPPWFPARTANGEVYWPNGAKAFVYTPEKPDTLFGPEHHLAWAEELHAWSQSTMVKAFANLRFGLRLGYGRLVWNSNPRRRHALIKMLLERSMREPLRHVVIRGATRDNRYNLTLDAIKEWEEEYAGTQMGREMLLGEQVDDDDAAFFKQAWIDVSRRHAPTNMRHVVVAVDPAVSIREGTDDTGVITAGLGQDGHVYVLGDDSGSLAWETWGAIALDLYAEHRASCLLVERNRGGDACVANLRAIAKERGLAVVTMDLQARLIGHVPGTVYVKEIISRTSKGHRAQAAAPVYECGRVHHVIGAQLDKVEDEMTTWDGTGDSPNRLDALVFCVWELADLWRDKVTSPKAVADASAAHGALRAMASMKLAMPGALGAAKRRTL